MYTYTKEGQGNLLVNKFGKALLSWFIQIICEFKISMQVNMLLAGTTRDTRS